MARVAIPSRWRFARGALGVVAILGAVAPPLRAEPAPSEVVLARRLFQEAAELEQRAAWSEAKAKLTQALVIRKTPGLYFHLAHCEEKLGELVAALLDYERAATLIHGGAAAPDVEELLGPARESLLVRVPELVLTMPKEIQGASIAVDGRVLSEPELAGPLRLDPGQHRVVAHAPGYGDFEAVLALSEGQAQTLAVSFTRPRAPAAATSPRPSATRDAAVSSSGIGTRGFVLLGEAAVTLVGLGVGIGFSVARGAATDDVRRAQRKVDLASTTDESGCQSASPPAACAELLQALDDHQRATRFATVGFVGAGVGAAATLITWALWPSSDSEPTASLKVAPEGATLAVGGRF